MSRLKIKSENLYEILKSPFYTEKAVKANEYGQYTFEIIKDATKVDVRKAVELLFPGRKIKKVRTVYMPSKQKRLGTKIGRTQSGKKAIVTIEGGPIEELIGV